MRRAVGLALVLLALLAGALAWLLLPAAPQPARFAAADCLQKPVRDAVTGAALAGIEDLAATEAGGLLLSAYDRRAAEAALARGEVPPNGGLYRIARGALLAEAAPAATPLLDADTLEGGLHPHGLFADAGELLAINRRLADRGGAAPAILRLRLESDGGQAREVLRDERLCAANDLVAGAAGLVLTLDRADCPGRSLREALWHRTGGRLVALPPTGEGARLRVLRESLSHPNGVVELTGSAGPALLVAETRAERLSRRDGPEIPLPGAPDNLNRDAKGGLVVALHPSLLRLALYRYGWISTAPARIAHVDPASGAVELLYDDPTGARFSAATSAVLVDGVLIAGSVLDRGLLVCGGSR